MEAALANADPVPDAAAKLWGHVVDALEAWLDRVEGRPVDASRWGNMGPLSAGEADPADGSRWWTMAPLSEWKTRRIDAHARWTEWARRLDAAELSREV